VGSWSHNFRSHLPGLCRVTLVDSRPTLLTGRLESRTLRASRLRRDLRPNRDRPRLHPADNRAREPPFVLRHRPLRRPRNRLDARHSVDHLYRRPVDRRSPATRHRNRLASRADTTLGAPHRGSITATGVSPNVSQPTNGMPRWTRCWTTPTRTNCWPGSGRRSVTPTCHQQQEKPRDTRASRNDKVGLNGQTGQCGKAKSSVAPQSARTTVTPLFVPNSCPALLHHVEVNQRQHHFAILIVNGHEFVNSPQSLRGTRVITHRRRLGGHGNRVTH